MNADQQDTAQLVWLKRDLRIQNHQPLAEAARRGPVICLFVYEASLLAHETFDPSHLVFTNQCLAELEQRLSDRGGRLICRVGEMPAVLEALHREAPFAAMWSHVEIGVGATFERDRQVSQWARDKGVAWHEIPQHGVVRGLKDRDGWAAKWRQQMLTAPAPPPGALASPTNLASVGVRRPADLNLPESTMTGAQQGGESRAHETLESFLTHRGVNYRKDMSSPVTAWEGCSRISPYLAYGAISMKQVYARVRDRISELKAMRDDGAEVDTRWFASLQSYQARLRWHCHFMQKLDDEPELEFQNMNRAYDGLREERFNEAYFDAWCRGQTGYPLIDACMRALHQTGWINFRMRAMLMSFAAYHLWLHWRRPAIYLATQFLDFEPGIHFPQAQMQSGVTGINTVRIYSPIKQVKDQDPEGTFIRHWVPELTRVPRSCLPEPHKMPTATQREAGCIIGQDYPPPIVDHAQAYKTARSRIYAVKGRAETRRAAAAVYKKHGSRRSPRRG